jgi:hypothetical protein
MESNLLQVEQLMPYYHWEYRMINRVEYVYPSSLQLLTTNIFSSFVYLIDWSPLVSYGEMEMIWVG